MLESIKRDVLEANLALEGSGLTLLTWGNVSAIERDRGFVVIKPSGIPYGLLEPSDMVIVDLEGRQVEGKNTPSTDTATHVELYKAFPEIAGVAHTHSYFAVMFAQACREIPCLGTTHADYFNGSVPVTREITEQEVEEGYEMNTGKIIAEAFAERDHLAVPGALVPHHGPFTWGQDPGEAFRNSLVLEALAEIAHGTLQLNPNVGEMPAHVRRKHYERKHGPNAYYGQPPESMSRARF